FGTATTFPVASWPWGLAVGDFNRDGKLDIATPNYGVDSVSILIGDGTGGFSAATSFPAGPHPNAIALGDFNNDEILDLAVTNSDTRVSILIGDGSGAFAAPARFLAYTGGLISIAVGDFNSDGNADLTVVGGAIVSVWGIHLTGASL
ncbi:MAG: VCBS repeat-containing protein, partial [Gammaproteobacteria bacterium]|nr:VCBS repeat-containing protein [Gammaproteobacteria bacterium]